MNWVIPNIRTTPGYLETRGLDYLVSDHKIILKTLYKDALSRTSSKRPIKMLPKTVA